MDLVTVFLKGIAIGFSIAAPIGPIGILCIRQTLSHGLAIGLAAGIGASVADAAYGIIAGFGFSFITNFLLKQQSVLTFFGSLFLFYIGASTMIARPVATTAGKDSTSLAGSFASTFFLTLTNPMTIILFLAVLSSFGLQAETHCLSAMVLVFGIFVGSAVWFIGLCVTVNFVCSQMSVSMMQQINRISGMVIIGFALLALGSLFFTSCLRGMEQVSELHYACIAGDYEAVNSLIAVGADIGVKNFFGQRSTVHSRVCREDNSIIQTPLHCAVQSGRLDVVALLLDAGAAQDINSDHNAYLNTPLHLAAWFGYQEIVKLLLERGAQTNLVNSAGSTPLHSACWNNEPECLKILIECGADYEQRNTTCLGNTPFYLAAKTGSCECINILIKEFVKKGILHENLTMKCSSSPGYTALEIAADRLHAQACWDLICAGASLDWKDVEDGLKCYKPWYDFLEKIKNWDLRISFVGNDNQCNVCGAYFMPNDVIISLANCQHGFHTRCFDDFCMRDWMEKNPHHVFFNRFKTDKERVKALYAHKPVCFDAANICPQCPEYSANKNLNIQQDAILSVYSPSRMPW